MTLAAGSQLGPYQIEELIGSGSMGDVYRAYDARLARQVAVKVLAHSAGVDRSWAERFELEGRAAAALNHPNIVAVYDVGIANGAPFIVSELLEGETLRARLPRAREGKGLPVTLAIDYARQIANGLSAAHHRGIIHRDLKPENLFVTRSGHLKILDFGLARHEPPQAADDGTRIATAAGQGTAHGVILGTVAYMSPEQARGERADQRSDLFSLGVVLFEMLVGQRPFTGSSSADTIAAILREEPATLGATTPNLPPALARIVYRCLEKDPAARFQAASDLAFSLEALSTGTAMARVTTPGTARWRRPALVASIAAAALTAGYVARPTLEARLPRDDVATFRPLTFQRGHIASARFGSDSESIVYAAAWDGLPRRVFSGRSDRPEARQLDLGNASLHAVSSRGDLAVSLGCFWQLRSSSCLGTLGTAGIGGGAPRELLKDVIDADWSPDGRELAVVRRVKDGTQLEFPIGTVLRTTSGWLSHARVSRDGRDVAVFEHPERVGVAGELTIVSTSGERTVVADGVLYALGVAWSPAGHLWFSADGVVREVRRDRRVRVLQRQPSAIVLHDVAPDGRALVTTGQGGSIGVVAGSVGRDSRNLSWFDSSHLADLSPDGRTILFDERGNAVRRARVTYLRPTDGGPAVRLGEGSAMALSPDVSLALVMRPANGDLELVPTGVGSSTVLPRGPIATYGTRARFFPDGKHLLLFGRARGQGLRAWRQPIDGAEPVPITSPLKFDHMAISPDGQWIVAEREGDTAAVRLHVTTGATRPITGLRAGEYPQAWAADGKTLIVWEFRVTHGALYRLDPDSGARERITAVEMNDRAGLQSITNLRVALDGRSYAFQYTVLLNQLFLMEGLQ